MTAHIHLPDTDILITSATQEFTKLTQSFAKNNKRLKNRNNNKRLPCCVQNILSLERISASFKKKSNKTNFCTYIQNNFIECYYEEVGDEEVILSPTNSSPDC